MRLSVPYMACLGFVIGLATGIAIGFAIEIAIGFAMGFAMQTPRVCFRVPYWARVGI